MATFYDLLASTEGAGSFDTLFAHAQNNDLSGYRPSEMTLAELDAFDRDVYGPWSKKKLGYTATPVGIGQIVGTTRRGIAKDLGLGDDTVFSEDTQRQMIRHLLDQTGGDLGRLRSTWEGFKHLSDDELRAAWQNYQGTGSIGMGGQVPVTAAGDGSIARGSGQVNAGRRESPRPPEPPSFHQDEYADNWMGRMQEKRDDMRAGLGEKLGIDADQMAGIGSGLQGLSQYLMKGGFG